MGALEVITVVGSSERHRDSPLLLVHGICHGAWCWQPNYAPYLAGLGYDVHAVSLRGHGGSAGHSVLHRYRLQDYVDDVVETAASLPSPPIVIGHSMGGAIAQVVAIDHPTAVRAAVLLAPLGPGALRLRELARTVRRFRRVPPLMKLLARGKVTPSQANRLPFFDNRLDDAGAHLAAEQLHDESWRALLQILTTFNTRAGAAPIPMLLVGSRQDAIFEAPSLRRNAAHYEIDPVILDTGCHDLMLDPKWRESADVIASWMEQL